MSDTSGASSTGEASGAGPGSHAGAEPVGDRSRQVRSLVEECLRRAEDDGPAVFEEVCARHPELATDIRARLAMLHAAGLLGDDAGGSGGLPGAMTDAIPERLGEFRLIARLGGGGMGVVYLAEQTSLQRRVALKLMRPGQLFFPGARERFRREAEAVARLGHPGIVPIYTVGEEAGVPYFAMEWVRGATLAEVLAELHARDPATLTGRDLQLAVVAIVARREGVPVTEAPPAPRESRTSPSRPGRGSDSAARTFAGTWVEACLRLAAQAAQALQHAHERGVLHRDVKPSNLMLTPDGRVLLFDFGLAAAEGSSRITRSGSQLGSLAYMSPEQVRGDVTGLDARSDVYSLGVTLYELLALAAPYASDDEQQLRAAILAGEPPSLRARHPAVSRDAETVCLVAMEAERARRYASPAALLRDLDNVLERRPVAARRPGPLLRARRFVQRHPAGSAALVLAVLLLVGGPLAWGLWERRANVAINVALDEARDQGELARQQGEEARVQRDAARADLLRAMHAVDTMLVRVGDSTLANVPQMEAVRRQLLNDAIGYYQELLGSHADEPALRLAVAHTSRSIGELAMVSADWDTAGTALEHARVLCADQLAESPDAPLLLTDLGDMHVSLAEVKRARGDVEAQMAHLAEARALYERRLALDPGDSHTRSALASVINTAGMHLERTGRRAEAEAPMLEALAQLQSLQAEFPDDLEHSRRVCFLQNNLGGLYRALGRRDDAERCYGASIARYAQLLEQQPADRIVRQELAQTRQNFGALLKDLGRPEDAEALYVQSLEAHRELVALFPESMDNRSLLAMSANTLAVHCIQAQRLDEAGLLLVEAIAAQEQAVAAAPASPDMHARLALMRINQAEVLARSERIAEARRTLEQAIAEQRAALDILPDHAEWTSLVRRLDLRLCELCRELRDWDAAQTAAEAYGNDPPGTAAQFRRAAGLFADLIAAMAAPAVSAPAAASSIGALPPDGADAARIEAWRARALQLLRRAIDAGYRDGADLATAADMAPLRESPEFEELLQACAADGG